MNPGARILTRERGFARLVPDDRPHDHALASWRALADSRRTRPLRDLRGVRGRVPRCAARRRRVLRGMPRRPRAPSLRRRRRCGDLRQGDARAAARPQHFRACRGAARIQDADLGLSRRPRRRGEGQRRPRDDAALGVRRWRRRRRASASIRRPSPRSGASNPISAAALARGRSSSRSPRSPAATIAPPISAPNSSPPSKFCSTATSRPSSSPAPGRALSATPNSCRRPFCAPPSISTATAART